MPAGKPKQTVNWITRGEARTILDAQARRVLGISGAEFITKWKSGKYRKLDSDQCPGIIELALLAPLPRQPIGGKKRKRSR